MGPGVLDKLVLRFNHVFWDRDIDWFNYIASIENRYDWTQTLNLYKFIKEPILVMFNCEPSAIRHSEESDEELLASGLGVLQTMFPQINL